ncbi:MAG: hypothetical protein COA73_01720 [Candidatus Hydrogenedentota bacterium]|nr:MAG: hypothetical protein COA73_01720 [Candidatus Hydrogenedentota bacterium]
MLQAHLDGELSSSEQVILDGHLSACPECQALLERHRHSTVELYETLAPLKLSRNLTQSVLDHLPEMEYTLLDVSGLNKRAKNPRIYRERMSRLVPIAAAGLLVFLAFLISKSWPSYDDPLQSPIGMVTALNGTVAYIQADHIERTPASLQGLTLKGDRYETNAHSQMMISLAGGSHIKLDENSRICIYDDRKIRIEKGQVFFDIGKDSRIFKVLTPSGDITVFGTSFNVEVSPESTSIAVREGEVQVDIDDLFRQIAPGQGIHVSPGITVLKPYTVDIESKTSWTNSIHPDDTAVLAYQSSIKSNTSSQKVMGHSGYLLQNINNRRIKQLEFSWKPNVALAGDRAGYLVYVYSENNEPIFKSYIDAAKLSNAGLTTLTLPNNTSESINARQAYVKLIPDFSSGSVETQFTKCEAILSEE